MNNKELKKILKLHKLWIEDNPEGMKADLSCTNLTKADLKKVNLSGADLSYADLSKADLNKADLSYADLNKAYLKGADLNKADLKGADLKGANLSFANLKEADLSFANLKGADLRQANLIGANLDFSCLPLSCRGLNIKIDKKIAVQLLFHALNQDCDDEEFLAIRNNEKVINFLNQFHVEGVNII